MYITALAVWWYGLSSKLPRLLLFNLYPWLLREGEELLGIITDSSSNASGKRLADDSFLEKNLLLPR